MYTTWWLTRPQFASVAAIQSWKPQPHIIIDPETAGTLCILWTKSVLDCLEHGRRSGHESLSDLQAMITTFFLVYNLEGFSSRLRHNIGTGVSIARCLGLHRIDYATDRTQVSHSKRGQLELEIMRRVWWHMAATDWLLSLAGGPSEGVYHVHPHHMAVNLPRNINDYHLLNSPPTFSLPLSEPTPASYLIQRIKLATICREIVDAIPISPSSFDLVPYETYIALDRKFQNFIDELPYFFKQDEENQKRSEEVVRQFPKIGIQRWVIGLTSMTRRCKLHQPFLVRGFTNPKYAYSRDVCLASARHVIEVKRQMENMQEAAAMMSLSGVNHHIFFAAIALVMDLCFNRVQGEDEERRSEVMTACRMLEEAKDRSPIAKKFVESLIKVLRKHKVKLDNGALLEKGALEGAVLELGSEAIEEAHPGYSNGTPDSFDALPPSSYDFEEIWQSYMNYGQDLEVPNWEQLFHDMEGTDSSMFGGGR